MPSRQSRYLGVSWHSRNHQWQAHLEDEEGIRLSLGLFGAEREAAEAFDRANLAMFGKSAKTNFPPDLYTDAELEAAALHVKDFWRPRPSSSYYGVYQTRGSSKWKAEIELHGVRQLLDFYDTEVEAAEAVDAAMRSTGVERVIQLQYLNFKRDSDYFDEDAWEEELVPRGATSRFLGVSYHQRSGQYLAKLGRKHVGLFNDELEAARAFDEASLAVGGPTNFKPVKRELEA